MTLTKALALYIQSLGMATLGQDLIIGRAPTSKETADDLWWIIATGGGTLQKNQTGESRKQYTCLVYRRGRNYRTIDEQLLTLEEQLNCDGCTQLDGFDTIDIEATIFPSNDDLDSVERMVGLLQVTVTTYKEC
jgi:hypothetical protein